MWKLILAVFLVHGIIAINYVHGCAIRAQTCADSDGDVWDVGFIEVGTTRLSTFKCKGVGTTEIFHVAYVAGTCKYWEKLPIITGNDINQTTDALFNTWQRVPYGGYFILVTSVKGYGLFQQLWTDRSIFDKVSTLLSDWRIVYDGTNTLLSTDEYVNSIGTPRANTDGMIIIAKKGDPSKSLVKLVGEDYSPRLVVYEFEEANIPCVQPLSDIERVALDPRIYGQDDTFKANGIIEDITLKNGGLHLVKSEPIGCDGTVYAWEFIAANNYTYTGRETFFTVMRIGSLSQATTIGKTKINIESSMISDELQPTYVCLKPTPISKVKIGDFFGYYTDDDTANPAPPPIKRVYPPKYTNEQYPCSRQKTWGDAGLVEIFNDDKIQIDGSNPFTLNSFRLVEMNIALKPILDHSFVYTCPCTSNTECELYNDAHMRCLENECQCDNGYVYNRKFNKCVYESIAVEKVAYQSSTLASRTSNNADKALDLDTTADILTGTCAKTTAGANPWWVLDMKEEMVVFSVQIKTPKPLDVYVEIWASASDYNNNRNPDAVLYEGAYPDIDTFPGVSDVEVIVTHGPFAWKILNAAESDKFVLNDRLKDGENVYVWTEFGSVGKNVDKLFKIVNIGSFEIVGQNTCWGIDDGNNLKEKVFEPGKACGDNITGQPFVFCSYVEPNTIGSKDFIIREVKTDLAVSVTSVSPGTIATLGGDVTTFRFYPNNANKQASDALDVAGLFNDQTGVLICPANENSVCLTISGGNIVLTTSCTTFFFLRKKFDDTLPVYTYGDIPWTDTYTDPPYLPVSVKSLTRPCYEIVRTTHGGGPTSDAGAAITLVDNSGYDINLVVRDPFLNVAQLNTSVLIRANDVGVHDFTIGVATEFDGTNFVASDFTTCVKFKGAPLNGRDFFINCDTPVMGRYVALYLTNNNANEKLQICNFKVHTLPDYIHSPIGSKCMSTADCLFKQDTNIYCNMTLDSNVLYGRCACVEGYAFHFPTSLCIDVNECVTDSNLCAAGNASNDGEVDGVCMNKRGTFGCQCPDGYKLSAVNSGYTCIDIDESELPDICGCAYSCYNKYVDRDGIKYTCMCPDGYNLTQNQHSCFDVNECEDGTCLSNYTIYCESNNCTEYTAPIDCINYPGSYDCFCASGFKWENNHCENINECEVPRSDNNKRSNGGCEFECIDHNPKYAGLKYECKCDNMTGYKLSENLLTCIDIDECNLNPCNFTYSDEFVSKYNTTYFESGACKNTAGSYMCACEEGYRWSNEDNVCYDVNECTSKDPVLHECEYQCQNTEGSYNCTCQAGYILAANCHSCVDKNECMLNEDNCGDYTLDTSSVHGACVNTIGNFTCHCPDGYRWECKSPCSGIYKCYDIDECKETKYVCEDTCTNKYADSGQDGIPYQCSCTSSGFELGKDGRSCIDIDECKNSSNICTNDFSAECVNYAGGYGCRCPPGLGFDYSLEKCTDSQFSCKDIVNDKCVCPDGFTVHGNACIDTDECMNNPCDGDCINSLGSYTCVCKAGFQVSKNNPNVCEDINECDIKNGGCMQTCSNNKGSYVCSCYDGYMLLLDQSSCGYTDICATPAHNCDQICKNSKNGYTCACNTGFSLKPDGKTCDDVNECDNNKGGCDQLCVNLVGSYYCTCVSGYILSNDQRRCVATNPSDLKEDLCSGQDKDVKGPNMINLQLTLNKQWIQAYANISSAEYLQVKKWIEYNLQSFFCSSLPYSYLGLQCKVVGPFKQGNLVVTIAVVTSNILSPYDKSIISYTIVQEIKKRNSLFIVNNTSVAVVDIPKFVYCRVDGSQILWDILTPCHYYDNTAYCTNGANCEITSGNKPVCKCLGGYTGISCMEISETKSDLSTAETGLISVVVILFIFMIILAVCICWLCVGKMHSPKIELQDTTQTVCGREIDSTENQMQGYYPNYYNQQTCNGYNYKNYPKYPYYPPYDGYYANK